MADTAGKSPEKGSKSPESPSRLPTSAVDVGTQPLVAATDAQNEEDDDLDSAIGSDASSSTASIQSSILAYREENGRTYHAYKEQINYVLPNDASEQDRLDTQHHLFMLTFKGKIFVSPAGADKTLKHVLDIGTGTGVWAMDMADDNPNTQVVGIDLSPIQPLFVPPNLSFQVDDVEDAWTFSHKFDFVFARMMTGSISDWPKLIRQSFDSLNPGGWMECQDICFPVACDDGTVTKDSFINQWSDVMLEAASKLGRDGDSAKHYKTQMEEAGFVNVQEVVYKWPSNRWPADSHFKELGFWCNQNIAGGLSGLSMALLTRILGWSADEVEVFLAKVRADMKDKSIHAWWPIYVVYGQKPE